MAESHYTKSDPSVLLLNEIDILLAQTRLMELYLKQAQATAANDLAQICDQHQAELTVLRASLVEKEQTVLKQTAAITQQQNLADRVDKIEGQLAERQRLLDSREQEIEVSRAESAALRERIAQLETAGGQAQAALVEATAETERLQAETAALRQHLESDRRDFQEQRSRASEREQTLHDRLAQLQTELAEKQLWSQNAAAALDHARGEIAALQKNLAELQAIHQEVEARTAVEMEQSRARLEDQIASLQADLDERVRRQQESSLAVGEIAATLQSEIAGLHSELDQKRQEIELRDGAWRDAQAEIAAVRERVVELETAHQQALAEKSDLNVEFDQARQSFENELAQLHHEITVKERELTQRYEAVSAGELALHGQIQTLREELARSQSDLADRQGDLQNARDEIADLRSQTLELENRRAAAEGASQRVAEETRQQAEEAINRLHAELAQKEDTLKELGGAYQVLENRLNVEWAPLREQIDRQQADLDLKDKELARSQAEIAALHEHGHEREGARQEAEENWQRSGVIQTELQARLQAKADELNTVQANAHELKKQLAAKLDELQLELARKQLLAESRSAEIENLQANCSQLAAQVAELESAQAQVAHLQAERDQSRLAHQRQIASQEEAFQTKYQALEHQLAQERENAQRAQAESLELARRTAQLETELGQGGQEINLARAESASLHGQLNELASEREKQLAVNEDLNRLQNAAQAEIAALQQALQQKTWAMAQQQATMENLASAHRNQLQNLQATLNERGDTRDHELEKARAHALAQQRRVEELETELRHAELTAIGRADQIKHEQSAVIAELHAALNQKTAELQELSAVHSQLGQSLRNEADRLVREVQERSQILQDRNDELVRVKAELDETHERYAQLESAASQAEASASGEVESLRSEFQAQLALLQAELSQKEWAVQEREAAARGLEQEYRQEIESLRRQLAEKSPTVTKTAGEFAGDRAAWAAAQQNKLDKLEATMAEAESETRQLQSAAGSHRWGSSFASKRRWKI